MDNFLDLNRQKIKFAFLATSSVFLAPVFILFVYSYFNGAIPEPALLVTLIFLAGIVIPMIIIPGAYFEWYLKKRVRQKAFRLPPFDRLKEIGFEKYYVFNNSRFHFTEEVKRGYINDYDIICDVQRNAPKKIKFRAITKGRQIDKDTFNALEVALAKHDIRFDFGGFTKTYDLKNIPFDTIEELKKDLERFTELLKGNGIEPLMENG